MNPELSKLEDIQLLQLSSKNNQQAFEEIFNRYWKRLYTYAYKIYNNNHVCEDIVQEVFVSLWRKNETTIVLNLEGYLFKSVKYKIANHIRDLKFSTKQLDYIESIPTDSVEYLEYDELEKEVLLSIEKLPIKCREVFKLSRLEQKSNTEIAEKLNLSIRTVETHISNALKSLRKNAKILEIGLLVSAMFL
ncbi:RNA polymerase sigma-70 factor [Winogradskyella vidalii]|uniref:RNA polymerase sigma-70 factor n=1 Tax=Winogradskyella vidalii TaxID=2615024 RepID=UPI0015C78D5D|nr:RNA polymerase sigma-70 factor [Winogradskyella vidalii]